MSMDINEKLELYYKLVNCNFNMYFWVYDPQMHLLSTTCPDELVLDGILTLSKNREYLLSYIKESTTPLMMSDSFGLMWAAVFETEGGQVCRIHIMGPAFVNDRSLGRIEDSLNRHNLSVQMKTNTLKYLKDLPVITSAVYFQYALMFHCCISGEQLGVSDINVVKRKDQTDDISSFEESSDTKQKRHIGAWDMDQELQKIIRDGNLNYSSVLSKAAVLFPGVKASLGDSIRHAKDTQIVFTAISTRAAIAGGLSPEIAHTVGDLYIERIENAKEMTELLNLGHTMFEDFVRRVHNLKQNPNISKPVQECCDYITMNLHRRLTIEELASLTGYTDYYLSRKFKKELGMSINDYIRKAKIDHAKMLLTSTQKSIQQISEELNFSSRSYFSDNFQKETGMSPRAYREANQ